jgi:poly-beta-1,6-N-acetyl-D-glucosamine synthase
VDINSHAGVNHSFDVAPKQSHPKPKRLPRRRNTRNLFFGVYLTVKVKYSIAVITGLLWMGLSIWLGQTWADELGGHVGIVWSWILIGSIALIPGFMNAFMAMSLFLDSRPISKSLTYYPGLTVLVAAYNEESSILDTLRSIHLQAYPGPLQVIVVSDGSTDRTSTLVRESAETYPWLSLVALPRNVGKANALNAAFLHAKYSLVATVDGDSWLHRGALMRVVERFMQDPTHTCAVAGAIMVRNSRKNWLTRMQEWDYFQGISSVKRVQSLYQGTLVAQGAFSLYSRKAIEEVGGFPDCVGEDIVLTWAMLKRGYRIGHCEDAILFTNVPETYRQFARQRHRWARGMIEAFKRHPSMLFRPRLSTTFIFWNLQFPLLDLAFSLVFLPGVLAACFGVFWIAGPATLALLPMAFLVNYFTFRVGQRTFRHTRLRVRFNPAGFINYSLFYSLLMQPVALWGYASELLGTRKSWGTK